ncbi:AAA domain-containing protein [Archangium gephyra]|nr:AAA domain-containing protein [Archangium gephyra]
MPCAFTQARDHCTPYTTVRNSPTRRNHCCLPAPHRTCAAPSFAPFPRGGLSETDEFLPVMGAAMGEWLPMLRVFAQQDETLLICGEPGTGKSRLARWFHAHSRRDEAFEVLELFSVPEELQMAELVGWKKGAFTGAVGSNVGSVARAEGGTLFIDEIDKLSLRAQAGLLHLLEERGYRALGEDTGKKRANVRFIIGTNANLLGAVRAGHFREDLYYRINVLPFRLPPLDERRDEIRPWARFMVERCKRGHGTFERVRLTAGAEQLLSSQPWPGNLRQLDNIVRRAFSLALVEAGDSGEVVIEEGSVARALACEAMPGPKTLCEALRRTARAFVEEACRTRSSASPTSPSAMPRAAPT